MSKSTAASGFKKATNDVKNRVIASSCGEVGSGKTSFWLGAPGPIYIHSFDRGLEGVVEPFTANKEIHIAEYDFAPAPGASLDQDEAVELREKFTAQFEYSIQHARTVLWDKEDDVWTLFKYAEFGPPQKGTPENWDSLKARLRRLINMSKATDVNFGIIRGMRNEWVPQVNPNSGKKGITQSGRRIPAGMEDVEGLVHINLTHVRIEPGAKGNEDGDSSLFQLRVGKSRGPGARSVQDQQFEGLTFSEFSQLVFPDSSAEDWE